jgi:hypothetical protein
MVVKYFLFWFTLWKFCNCLLVDYSAQQSVSSFTPFILKRWNGDNDKRLLVVIVTNDSYEQYLASWVKQLKSFADYNYIIELAEPSQQCQSRCLQYNLTCTNITGDFFSLPLPRLRGEKSNPSSQKTAPGILSHIVASKKPMVVYKTIKLGYDVLFADIDVYWNKDLVRIVQRQAINKGNDLVASTHFSNPNINSGLYYMRSNFKTITFTNEWYNLMRKHPRHANDQAFLNANLGISDFCRTTPSTTNLSWSYISNHTFSLYEANLEYDYVYAACQDYSPSNDLLASIHLTNPIGGAAGKHVCMKELYAGFFPQLMTCKNHIPDDKYPKLECFLFKSYLYYKNKDGPQNEIFNIKRKHFNHNQIISRLNWDKVYNRDYGENGFIL